MARWMWAGSTEEVTARIEDRFGEDISGISVEVQHRSDRVKPEVDDPAWETPTSVERLGTVVHAVKLVTGIKLGTSWTRYWVWVKVVDGPETYIENAGYYSVR